MSRLIRWLLEPGPPDRVPPLAARILLAAVFIPIGMGKFLNHDAYIDRFERWGFPAPGASAYLAGVTEVGCGFLMLLGVLPRPAGLALLGTMVGAFTTAGLQDGGQDLWLPPVMAALAVYVVIAGAGRLRLHERLIPRSWWSGSA